MNNITMEDELPKANFMGKWEMQKWGGCWFVPGILDGAVAFNTSFDAQNDDVFIASYVKTGTTWLKALSFCIMQRHNQQTLNLLTLESENPHALVPTVETASAARLSEAAAASAPRLLHTHLPHSLLPDSVKNSSIKIVYVARNPSDAVISSWHFHNSFLRRDEEKFPLKEFVDCFCYGPHPYGPFVEHVAGYWEESKKSPQKILFLKYEELKADPKSQVLKIAEFLGRPFGDGEEGEADEIVRRYSFERLKNLEVNKSGALTKNDPLLFTSKFLSLSKAVPPNSAFFRKGEVGDSKHYLTSEMEMQIDQTIRLKLQAVGLYFRSN